jgi:hypothetical protein
VIKVKIILPQNGLGKIVQEFPGPTIMDPVILTKAPCLVWVVRVL